MNWAAFLCKARSLLLFALILAASIVALYTVRDTVRAAAHPLNATATALITNCAAASLVQKS